ncbi:MAG TPA: hypothetical protein VNV44_15245 [Solirubrobacteraceae bacterium]|nr:hypothetical protein [Solirubrobacteraceae bacterium]
MAKKVDMALVELASGTWSETLLTLSRECAGGAAAVRSSGPGRSSLGPASPHYRPLQGLRYDEEQQELEVSIGLDAGEPSSLRCFVSEPRRIFLARRPDVRALIVLDASGASTWIELVAAGDVAAVATRGVRRRFTSRASPVR